MNNSLNLQIATLMFAFFALNYLHTNRCKIIKVSFSPLTYNPPIREVMKAELFRVYSSQWIGFEGGRTKKHFIFRAWYIYQFKLGLGLDIISDKISATGRAKVIGELCPII
jgi:hypothetical protein